MGTGVEGGDVRLSYAAVVGAISSLVALTTTTANTMYPAREPKEPCGPRSG